MNGKRNISLLPWLVCICGGMGAALWELMNTLCRDEKGLLRPWNLPGILLAVLSVALCVLVLWKTRHLDGTQRYGVNFPPSPWSGLTSIAAALGILWMLIAVPAQRQDMLATVHRLLGFLSIPCLILTGLGRWKGKRPNFLFHGILCLFFGIHLAEQYRVWSSDPETADYLCQLLACAGLTFTAYHRTAFDAGLGKRKQHLITGLLTAYFCLTSLFVEGSGCFYLTCGLWAGADLCLFPSEPSECTPEEGGTSS